MPRFPSSEWITDLLYEIPDLKPHEGALSLHVCGKLLRSILADGSFPCGAVLTEALHLGEFQRMQLNFHGETVAIGSIAMDKVVLNIIGMQANTRIPEIIVQLDGVNDWILKELLLAGIKASGLYDRSHGAGIKPDSWPKHCERRCSECQGDHHWMTVTFPGCLEEGDTDWEEAINHPAVQEWLSLTDADGTVLVKAEYQPTDGRLTYLACKHCEAWHDLTEAMIDDPDFCIA